MRAQPAELVVEGELRSLNPATLEVLGSVRTTDPGEVEEVVGRARTAQARWAEESLDARRRLVLDAARVLLERMDELASAVTAETGKPLVESYTAELLVSVENARWVAANAPRVLRPERAPFRQLYLKHKRGFLVYEPLGVVAILSPWNFPFAIPFTQAVAALAAGNAVVLKPSELTPLVGEWVERVLAEAGAPAGLVQTVQGPGEVAGDALVRAPGVAKVVFTGSTRVGRRIGVACAELLRPVTLELGGKDPMIVLADADLARAVEGALWGAFSNCGQVCAGVERIYVARECHEEFASELARRAGELRLGPGEDARTDVGPLISERQRATVEDVVADARERGAETLSGGRRPALGLPGWFYEPTVLANGDASARAAREEVFGPVVTVAPFADEEEAIRLANGTPYGLGASVWTRDLAGARRVAGRLAAGSVWTNDVAYSYGAGQASWGGVKESGLGRTHSKHGLYECTQVKFVDSDRGRVPVPWWYPYGPEAVEAFRGTLGVLHGDGVRTRLEAGWRHRRGLAHLARRYLSGR
jgi:acyl-CoA reductase-like NAD-dependent aldehyde dehydrogenase